MRISKIFMVTFMLVLNSMLFADNFVSPASNSSILSAKTTPLTPFDEALKREMQKYPKDFAFFIDGRTGKIISVSKLPKSSISKSLETSKSLTQPTKTPKTPREPPKQLPYQMQEERIQLL